MTDMEPHTATPPPDSDEAMLRALVVADPAARRRVFTALLRAMTGGGR